MKPKFLFLALLLMALATTAFSQKHKANDNRSTTIRFSETFTTVSINDDLNVVLIEGALPEITVEGTAKHAIEAKVTDGHLYLGSRGQSAAPKGKVYVPVGLLTKVFVHGNGVLQSASVLNHNRLKVFLAGEAKINLRSTGSVTVETLNDIQFVKGR